MVFSFLVHFIFTKKIIFNEYMLSNQPGTMLWVWTVSRPLGWCWEAWFVNDEGILAKFSAITKEFLYTTKEFLQNFHQKYRGIGYSQLKRTSKANLAVLWFRLSAVHLSATIGVSNFEWSLMEKLWKFSFLYRYFEN